ncbi:hypothetical protein U9M48_008773 [Paspalum notatum var. saurae]|uniref:Transposase n=1 Tax=Paspalum notatum var. saurae TaxID=547442 RepID=A0AAQ3SR37_PASNO
MLKGLGMSYDKIDACENNCMLLSKNGDEKLSHCKRCGKSRYVDVLNEEGESVTTKVPLYLSNAIAHPMRWSKKRKCEHDDDIMIHPSYGEAWQALDRFDPEFASDPRSIRFGLSTDGFTPFGIGAAPYSCWPVFVVPYNLPPHLCMKEGFVFLAMVILGSRHPGKNLNVFLEPLIEELQELWIGVEAYDVVANEKFTLRAAYLFSFHDLLPY